PTPRLERLDIVAADYAGSSYETQDPLLERSRWDEAVHGQALRQTPAFVVYKEESLVSDQRSSGGAPEAVVMKGRALDAGAVVIPAIGVHGIVLQVVISRPMQVVRAVFGKQAQLAAGSFVVGGICISSGKPELLPASRGDRNQGVGSVDVAGGARVEVSAGR